MGKHLDLNDVAEDHPVAKAELAALLAEVERLQLIESFRSDCIEDEVKQLISDAAAGRRLKEIDDFRSLLQDDNVAEIMGAAAAGRRLPLTADGVLVVPDKDDIWQRDENDEVFDTSEMWFEHPSKMWRCQLNGRQLLISECYSTLEALCAAKE